MAETPVETKQQKRKSEKIGQVVSDKMAKTIVVEVIRKVPHPLYKRIITKRKKFYAHDEQNVAKTGDTVRILEARPMSHLKRWTLGEVMRKAVDVGPVNITSKETLPSKKTGAKRRK